MVRRPRSAARAAEANSFSYSSKPIVSNGPWWTSFERRRSNGANHGIGTTDPTITVSSCCFALSRLSRSPGKKHTEITVVFFTRCWCTQVDVIWQSSPGLASVSNWSNIKNAVARLSRVPFKAAARATRTMASNTFGSPTFSLVDDRNPFNAAAEPFKS